MAPDNLPVRKSPSASPVTVFPTVSWPGERTFAVENEIQLVVHDAGAGFYIEEAKKNQGLGLVSMQERTHLVHGRFAVDSTPGKGTRVFAAVPFAAEKESAPETHKVDSAQEVA